MAIEVKGRYHTSAPTYNVNGQIGYLELDASGNLKVTLESGSINVGAVDIKGTSDGGTTWYPLKAGTDGVLAVNVNQVTATSPTIIHKHVAFTASTTGTIWTPTNGTSFVITHITISASAAGTVTIIYTIC